MNQLNRFKLGKSWRKVLKRAWSVRLLAAAALLSALEAILPLFEFDLPRSLFATATFTLTMLALVARVMVQRGVR